MKLTNLRNWVSVCLYLFVFVYVRCICMYKLNILYVCDFYMCEVVLVWLQYHVGTSIWTHVVNRTSSRTLINIGASLAPGYS